MFFDVDATDRPSVLKEFPKARFLEPNLSEGDIVRECRDTEIISLFINTQFTRTIIEHLPALKLLCTRSVGTDHIDLKACRERGILVCNVPDYGSHVIAEHVFALLLATFRHIPLGHARVLEGHFDYHGLRGIALKGKTIGIVGTGKIGRQVAKIAHGFGMTILATDIQRTEELVEKLGVIYVPLPELLSKSDIVTLHAPALPEIEHMIDAKAFAAMKRGAVLVNTARGSLIESKALLDALNSERLSYALLDVLEHEQNFEENKALIEHSKVVTTPHIAFYADDSMRTMYEDSFVSIRQWMEGRRPVHAVDFATMPPVANS